MWYYKAREYVSWIILFALLAAVIFYGYRLATQQNLVRLGTGPEGSVTHEMAQQLQHSIERHSDYQVQIVAGPGSRANREALLRDRLDLAIVAPAALSSTSGVRSLSSLGKATTHLILRQGDGDDEARSVPELAQMRLAVGVAGGDDARMARDFLGSLGLLGQVEREHLDVTALADSDELDGALVTTHTFDSRLRALFATGDYRLFDQHQTAALVAEKPLYRPGEIHAGLYPAGDAMVPESPQQALQTPLALMAHQNSPRSLVYRIMQVLDQEQTQSSLVPFGFDRQRYRDGDPSLVRHLAAIEYLEPRQLFSFVSDGMRVLQEYRWLVLLSVLVVALGLYRWLGARRDRRDRLQQEREQAVRKLMQDVLRIEDAQKTERDWKVLEQYAHDVSVMKNRGLSMMLDHGMGDSVICGVFTQQCNHVTNELNWRLSLRQTRGTTLAASDQQQGFR